MVWTPQTAAFFITIAVLLVGMAVWEWRRPGGSPRQGILGVTTTRWDPLFVSLLLSSYVHLGWLALVDWPLWLATELSALVFRHV